MSPAHPEPAIQRVSTFELFFDLVFVFAVTQLTGLVAHPHDPLEYAKATLVFLTLMWIYDGFAWLTNNVRVQTDADYWYLSGGMASFLVMSLAIPTVFGAGGLAYGLGLLVATLIHAWMFRQAQNRSARAILGIVPYNLTSALLVLGAAWTPLPWKWALWTGAVAMPILATLHRREGEFNINATHFAERHGLLIIIALGESVVGIGKGASGLELSLPVLAFAVLGLYVAICIWASYFDEDDERGEHALAHAPPDQRPRMALLGYGYGHMAMIAGIILAAAGLEAGIHHPTHAAAPTAAWNLAAGLALYVLGDVGFRRVLGIRDNRLRLAVGAGVLLTGFLGQATSALIQVGACGLLLTILWTLDER